jgi:hypothetical protein
MIEVLVMPGDPTVLWRMIPLLASLTVLAATFLHHRR